MCHDDDSRAPAPPVRAAVAGAGGITLTSTDGTPFGAYQAMPAGFGAGGPGIVLLPDVRGLHPYYRDLAVRFAEAGLPTVAVDYFGRTAGASIERGDDFEWAPHAQQVRPATVEKDVAAAVEWLRSEAGAGPLFTVGFCLGGSQSWRLSASSLDFAGVIGFYGMPKLVRSVLDQMRAPLLLLVAGADSATPRQEFADLDAALTERGVEHDMVVYEGAPHSFFDRSYAQWHDAGADAWRRMLSFVAAHS